MIFTESLRTALFKEYQKYYAFSFDVTSHTSRPHLSSAQFSSTPLAEYCLLTLHLPLELLGSIAAKAKEGKRWSLRYALIFTFFCGFHGHAPQEPPVCHLTLLPIVIARMPCYDIGFLRTLGALNDPSINVYENVTIVRYRCVGDTYLR